MPRKKAEEREKELKEKIENAKEDKEIVEAKKEKIRKSEEIAEKAEELSEEEASKEKPELKKPKKREKKKLSESELRRVMTDTKETIVPLTDYIACSVHLGTKVITPDMRKYVYKRRADGLAVLNTNLIDDKLREAAEFLKGFNASDIFIVCKREAGWPAVEKFSETTGVRCFCKKYPAGIITNLQLETFFEPKLAIVCDPWVDKNALNDAVKLKLPVLGICDTNNYTFGISQIVPANNKSRKSIGLCLFVLAREYLKNLGKNEEAKALKLEDFSGKLEEAEEKSSYDADAKILGEETSVGEAASEGV
jgi:ribosomal protein uS2